VLAIASVVGGTTEPILMEASRKDEMGDEAPRTDWRCADRLFPAPVIETVHLSPLAGAVQSQWAYAAEAYRLVLTLVELIVKGMFEPLRFLSLAALLLGVGGGLWILTLWRRRRQSH